MRTYCGTDIIEVERIKSAILENDRFKNNVFSASEIEDIDKISNDDVKYQRYAGRFAAKEAIYKAISEILVKEEFTSSFLDVEILNFEEFKRRPYVNVLNKSLEDIFTKHGVKIDLSISHVKENAIATAVVVAEKE